MTARGIRPAGGSQDEFPPCVRLPVHVAQFGRGVVASTADWDAWRTRVEQSEMFEHFVRQVSSFTASHLQHTVPSVSRESSCPFEISVHYFVRFCSLCSLPCNY